MIKFDKLLLVPVLFGLACLCAGLFGACHNQISYSVSPEYFTRYKFHQFNISEDIPHGLGAAIVGWSASWWMGTVIGIFVIPFGLLIPGKGPFFRGTLRAFVIVAITALACGLAGLVFAWLTLDPDQVGQLVRYHNEIQHDVAFVRAGSMHNMTYVGGIVGIFTGCLAIWRYRRQVKSKMTEEI